jgi:hypothetical protein
MGRGEEKIGPQIPAHLLKRKDTQAQEKGKKEDMGEDESSELGVIGPALPPHLMNRNKRRVMGPAAPPSSTTIPLYRHENDDDDDDDIGPAPIPEQYSQAIVSIFTYMWT